MHIKTLIKKVLYKISFYYRSKKYTYKYCEKKKMKINLILEEKGWILQKFADNVRDELRKIGVEASISDKFDSKADINHYFIPNMFTYNSFMPVDNKTTFMITHVDTAFKVDQINDVMKRGAIGICMSKDTMDKLISYGIKRTRICYINPAQDGCISPRKIILGFTNRIYFDGRKRDNIVLDICKSIDSKYFSFKIMGAGWASIVDEMREMGFEVEYYPEFDKAKYNELILSLDYYCYFGYDEGSMGILDAISAGVKTIVTPQGYHLDVPIPITHAVNDIYDIIDVLMSIEYERKKSVNFSQKWSWHNYTLKHLEIWKYMLSADLLENLLKNRGYYCDGIFSLLLEDLRYDEKIDTMVKNTIKNGIKIKGNE